MQDPREALLLDIDNSKTRVIGSPEYIVVCGGLTDVHDECRNCSARNIFLSEIHSNYSNLAKKLLVPEDFVEWNHYGVYPDLLKFETDLAYLTGAIVLFVESPGSIAELGSFSCIPSLAKKLLVVMQEAYYRNNSFIYLGPIKLLENADNNQVFIYKWKSDNSDFNAHVPDLVNGLTTFSAHPRLSKTFLASEHEHRLLLLVDLIELFVIVGVTELENWLHEFFKIDLTKEDLRRYLFLFEKVNLIHRIQYGKNIFYLASAKAQPYIEYGTRSDTFKQDRARFKARVLEYYNHRDRTKIRAFRNHKPHTRGGV